MLFSFPWMSKEILKFNSLSIEITGMFIAKLLIIYGLWAMCFSHPIDKSLTPQNIAAHIFNLNEGKS